jgi:cytochrome c biogenesis protein CcdA|tara:strand:- start:221 stop:481 length:261 start_codon:yes stop_codon:yes gene_type:complete
MEVPTSWRPKMKRVLKRATSPIGAFFIGFLISLFLLPCTAGPYFVILGVLGSESANITNNWINFYIVFYNLIFILPMLAIAVIMTF